MTTKKGDYWTAIKNSGLQPNFWCSEEYWAAAGWTVRERKWWEIRDQEENLMLPAITSDGMVLSLSSWSTLIGQGGNHFLDWNYMYDPKNFSSMLGGTWSKFRKNCRKWPRRYSFDWRHPEQADMKLVENWATEKARIQDWEVLAWYCTNAKNQLSLIHADQVVAWLAWDENPVYTNFRWLLVDPDHPFLDEYCRWFFYTRLANQNKLVNDGGSLNRMGLEQFKDSLQPVRKEPIYTQ